MSACVPLHHNSGEKPWTRRAAEIIDLWTTMAALNPDGFRQPRISRKRKKQRGPAPSTRLERIVALEAKLA